MEDRFTSKFRRRRLITSSSEEEEEIVEWGEEGEGEEEEGEEEEEEEKEEEPWSCVHCYAINRLAKNICSSCSKNRDELLFVNTRRLVKVNRRRSTKASTRPTPTFTPTTAPSPTFAPATASFAFKPCPVDSPALTWPPPFMLPQQQDAKEKQEQAKEKERSRENEKEGVTEEKEKEKEKGEDEVEPHRMSLAGLEKRLRTSELELTNARTARDDLSQLLASVKSNIAQLTDDVSILRSLVRIRKDNADIEEESRLLREKKESVEAEVIVARDALRALNLQREQQAEKLEQIKKEKIEIRELAAKKREVEDLASELESRKMQADTLRARLEEGEAKLLSDREGLEEERNALAEEKVKMSILKEFTARKVKLNIGGDHFQTSLTTLTNVSSMFSAMFSGKYLLEPEDDGGYFIDRDPTHFRYILNYLRDSSVEVPTDEGLVRELLTEAEFYQVDGLIALLQQYLGDEHLSSSSADGSTSPPSSPSSSPFSSLPFSKVRPYRSKFNAEQAQPKRVIGSTSTVSSSTTRIHSRPALP